MIKVTIASVNPRWRDAQSEEYASIVQAATGVRDGLREEIIGTDWSHDESGLEKRSRVNLMDAMDRVARAQSEPLLFMDESLKAGPIQFMVGVSSYEPVLYPFEATR